MDRYEIEHVFKTNRFLDDQHEAVLKAHDYFSNLFLSPNYYISNVTRTGDDWVTLAKELSE